MTFKNEKEEKEKHIMKEIFATKERKEILREFNIRFYVDQDLNSVFRSKEDEKKAAKVLKAACEL